MIPPRLRAPLAACGAGLLLLLAFPESLGLWPLRLISAWPGEIGRALGNLLFAGQVGPLALSQGSEIVIKGATGPEQALAVGLGLMAQIAAGLALFRIAETPRPARWLLFALAGVSGLAAIMPPASAVSAAELGAALVIAALGMWPGEAARRMAVQFLGACMLSAPLADLRPVLLSTGRPTGAIGILEAQTGVPALVLAVLIAAVAVAGLVILPPSKPVKVRA